MAERNKAKKRAKEPLPSVGRAYVTATFNNTIITLTTPSGETICWGSCGTAGFKGARKATPYAATTTAMRIARKGKELGLKRVSVYIKGPGSGRDAAVKAIRTAGLEITSLADVTPIPHNGCRPKKRRKV